MAAAEKQGVEWEDKKLGEWEADHVEMQCIIEKQIFFKLINSLILF